MNQQNTS